MSLVQLTKTALKECFILKFHTHGNTQFFQLLYCIYLFYAFYC